MTRPRVAFIAWATSAGRARDLAADLDGEAYCTYPRRLSSRRLVPVRYAVSAALTIGYLIRRRPRAVVVQNPPVFPGLIALAYARITRSHFVLDNHPTSFGAKDNAQGHRMLGVTRFLARQALGVLVTTDSWVDVLTNWKANGLVIHEAPPHWSIGAPTHREGRRARVLFVCVFASDEPVEAVIEVAHDLPDVDFRITGETAKAGEELLSNIPANVVFTGWLNADEYAAAVAEADVLLALTTEPTSIQRSAYEAVYARRTLVLSDWPDSTVLFPDAVATDNSPTSIADALRRALDPSTSPAEIAARAEKALSRQEARWDQQRTALRALLGISIDDDLVPAFDTGDKQPNVDIADMHESGNR